MVDRQVLGLISRTGGDKIYLAKMSRF